MEKKKLNNPVREAYLLGRDGLDREIYFPRPRVNKDSHGMWFEPLSAGTFFVGEYKKVYDLPVAGKLEETVLSDDEWQCFINITKTYQLVLENEGLSCKKTVLQNLSNQLINMLKPCKEGIEPIKKKVRAFGRDFYLLGVDKHGDSCYVGESVRIGDWWKMPDVVVLEEDKDYKGLYKSRHTAIKFSKSLLKELKTPFDDDEIFLIGDTFEKLKTELEYAMILDFANKGCPLKEFASKVANESELKRLFDVVIPATLDELYKILGGEYLN